MNKRLLFITRHRLNESNGGANCSKANVQCFAQLFDDCSLIFPEIDDTSLYVPTRYKLFPCHDGRSLVRKGIDMYRGVVSPLSAFTRQHLSTHNYDVIVIDHSFIASDMIDEIRATGAQIITIHHNVERDYLRDNARMYSILYRKPYVWYGEKAERSCLQASSLNLTLTEQDASAFRSWFKDANLHVHCWGVHEYKPIPDKVFKPRPKGHHFVITGSLSFWQSLMPIMEFLQTYWPCVVDMVPDAQLTITGRNPQKMLTDECRKHRNVTVIPNPDNINSLVEQADYYICPINAGSGLKLRVMDALRNGLQVICHEVSAAGYEHIVQANGMFCYRDKPSFAEALSAMLSTSSSPTDVYQAYRETFSLEAGVEKLRAILLEENILQTSDGLLEKSDVDGPKSAVGR